MKQLNDLEGNLRGKFVQKVRGKEEELRAMEDSLLEDFEKFQQPLLKQREELQREAQKLVSNAWTQDFLIVFICVCICEAAKIAPYVM